ncbi:TetR/AcrR family transcriptional regulator [Nonomuraea sediminis]|uniref:TetR/AcrR family transcriptional regulator n=1 Tax=Nonomuraea sediminis TaxID=2835864 RepID=UPI001BDBC7C0|nr:TetR/AcrR family transcriptional regulator [Nonomuraea sediminis]
MAKTHDAERAGIERRAKIVNAALTLFATQGYRGTSLMAVAEAAGITQSGLLHHFSTKQALLAEVLAERDRQTFDAVEIGRDYSGPAVLRALEIVHDIVERSRGNRELTRLGHLGAFGSNEIPEIALAWARERTRTFHANLSALVAEGIAVGDVRADADPDAVASLVIATISGLEEQWLLDESFDMLGAVRAFVRLLRHDLLVTP